MPIRDKVILITGATSFFGRHLAEALSAQGAKLALCVRRMDAVDPTERDFLRRGIQAFVAPCDLRYEEDVVRMVHRVIRRFGRIDGVINAAAALGPHEPVIDYPVDPWRNVLATNVTGTFLVCREVLPWMHRHRFGRIVNITTQLTEEAKAEWGAYLVSNHAVEGLTQLLAAEVNQADIRVNCFDIGMPLVGAEAAEFSPRLTNGILDLLDETCEQNGERVTVERVPLHDKVTFTD
ncbi:MAG: SDR family oxidoreductase [Planctomycetes bacterium]|nr:SDR family oxidoreductase [Planctomycetota bacterium]